jgi:dephospho-CoA kinase
VTAFRNGSKPVIGLIGAIGAGKTSAAAAFQSRGGMVINADALGHAALEEPAIRQQLVARWGTRIIRDDGTLDRRAIAGIVFPESGERVALERLVFPYIRERATAEILRAQQDSNVRFIVLDAAVLLEAGWNDVCDRIVYIDAPRAVRLARLATRSGWTADDLRAREAAQWPDSEKVKRADAVIVNEGSPERLQGRLDELMKQWNVPVN